MPENDAVLQEILEQSRKAADGVQDLRVEMADVSARLAAHQEQDRENFERLNRSHAAQGSQMGQIRQQLGQLQGHKEAAKTEGAKAGRKHGIGWAAAITGLAALAKEVWPYLAHALGLS